jgi:DNA-binding protein YbaB
LDERDKECLQREIETAARDCYHEIRELQREHARAKELERLEREPDRDLDR